MKTYRFGYWLWFVKGSKVLRRNRIQDSDKDPRPAILNGYQRPRKALREKFREICSNEHPLPLDLSKIEVPVDIAG